MASATEKLSEKDRQFIWHPLTQHKLHSEMKPLKSAKGVYLIDENGNQYIDAISSWYCTMYGHCNPAIMDKVKAQLTQLDHVVFSGFTHRPSVELSEKLIEILPENQAKVFYSDNGSTATEVGIKMALQYHYNRGENRPVLLAFENGFHGDTFGAMSVSGLDVYNAPFKEFSLRVERIPVPQDHTVDEIVAQCRALATGKEVAGFVYEPLVQGAASMTMYKAAHLDRILRALKEYGVLTIADEVMTGFGKTGTYFASEQVATKPDIICLSKALTAGVVPMGATSCTSDIFAQFYSDEISKGFFHGHTYTANAIACTAALAGIDLLMSDKIQENIQRIIRDLREFELELRNFPGVKQTRQLGVILALDLDVPTQRYGQFRDKLYSYFMDNGVFLRPLGNTVYIVPPYTITVEQLREVFQVIKRAVKMVSAS